MIWWALAILFAGTAIGRIIRYIGDARAISRGTYGKRVARRSAFRAVRRFFG